MPMPMRLSSALFLVGATALLLPLSCSDESPSDGSGGAGGEAATATQNKPQQVIGWIPPYGISAAREVLEGSFGDVTVASTLTRVGLQFWTITPEGELAALESVDDEDAQGLIELSHAHDIEVLATITNDGGALGTPGFHWGVVREALKDGGDVKVTEALMELVLRLNLDGVDLDFEAGGPDVFPYTDTDRELFLKLVVRLGDALHKEGKLLTVDTFVGDAGTVPAPSWWSGWVGYVDAIHGMGYTQNYRGGAGSASYQVVQDKAIEAGFKAEQLLLGFPVWVDAWAGDDSNYGVSHADNLNFITHCLKEGSGAALWAIHHPAAHTIEATGERPWSTEEPWALVKDLKDGVTRNPKICEAGAADDAILDDLLASGVNKKGGQWLAATDYWDRPEADRELATQVLTADGTYDLALGEGVWGDIAKGYRSVSTPQGGDLRVLSTQVSIHKTLTPNGGWGGLWTEFLPRDCTLLDDPTDGCSWRTEALVGYDASSFGSLTVGLRCPEGQKVHLLIDAKEDATSGQRPFGQSFDCTGEFEDYELALKSLERWPDGGGELDTSALTRLMIEYISSEAPSELTIDLAGVAFDQSVLELRGLKPSGLK